VEFRILGPLEVVADGVALHLGTPRQRTLLGMLLIWAGDVVSQDRPRSCTRFGDGGHAGAITPGWRPGPDVVLAR